jgi:hypothetical protein
MSILVTAKEFGGAIMGVLWNKYVLQMTKDDYHRLPDAMLVIVIMRIISLSYIYFLPSNQEVREVQNKLDTMIDV